MTTLFATTIIDASIAKCFELSLSIDLEADSVSQYGTHAIAGVTTGMIKAGEHVTWRSRQFGIWVTHETEITGFNEPRYFQDSMVRGLFRSFHHNHFFQSLDPERTEMRDELSFSMPAVLLGYVSEQLVVKRRLARLLWQRNVLIKQTAESAQ